MSKTYNYIPKPPRVWSRVQNPCTYTVDSSYNITYIPLTNQYVTQTEAKFKEKQLYKGNILQYKANSSTFSKNQKYSRIAKGLWCNRTKVFATQTQTYSNPNTTGLKRINYNVLPFPNQIVGAPNNISGPFQYGIPNPFSCNTSSIQDGGTLLCNAYANPCTGTITQRVYSQQCFPTFFSDVPGKVMNLCWNPKVDTWYPKQHYYMGTSGTKWPEGYKGFVSAAIPIAPVLSLDSSTDTTVTLSWTDINSICLPISKYNIYENNILIQIVPYTVTTITLNIDKTNTYVFYVRSVSTTIESPPSNVITI
jgi:hypothetical protein